MTTAGDISYPLVIRGTEQQSTVRATSKHTNTFLTKEQLFFQTGLRCIGVQAGWKTSFFLLLQFNFSYEGERVWLPKIFTYFFACLLSTTGHVFILHYLIRDACPPRCTWIRQGWKSSNNLVLKVEGVHVYFGNAFRQIKIFHKKDTTNLESRDITRIPDSGQ